MQNIKHYLFGLSLFFALSAHCQDKYNTSCLLEWGNGGNSQRCAQSLGVYGQSNLVKNILYLDFGGKAIIPVSHAKNNVATQALLGLQLKAVNIKGVNLFLGARGGYGWLCGKNKDFKGGVIEPLARFTITKHLSIGYSFNHQWLGHKSLYANTHECKIAYLL